MDKVEFEKLYAPLLKINPEILLRTGICAMKSYPESKIFTELTGYRPHMVFKYEVSNGYIIYISFGYSKEAAYANCNGTIGVMGWNLYEMRMTNMMDRNFGIIGNLMKCGNATCIKTDPFGTEFCNEHNEYIDANDIIKFAKESMPLSEIPKERIVLIEYVAPNNKAVENTAGVIPANLSNVDLLNHPDQKGLFKDLLKARSSVQNQITERDKLQTKINSVNDVLQNMRSKADPCFDHLIEIAEKEISKLDAQVQNLNELITKSNHVMDNNVMLILGVGVRPKFAMEKDETINKHECAIKEFDADTENQIQKIRETRQIEKDKMIGEQQHEIKAIDVFITEIDKILEQK